MDLTMTRDEQDAFLAAPRVGVLGVGRGDDSPLLIPLWYRFAEDVVEMVTSSDSVKARLLRETGTASLCVQREEPPYAYVTVAGDVTVTPVPDGLVEAIATRYLGHEEGKRYADGPGQQDDTLIALRVRTRRSSDFGKLGS